MVIENNETFLFIGIFVKSETLWDILKIENNSAVLTNHSAVLNQYGEKIQILESYHGKLTTSCNQITVVAF